ncbi:MAG: hypothetical protein AB1744_00830 [Candidatus Zixiibacteriota bacterium]
MNEALQSRATGTVEEVTQLFQKAAAQSGNPGQRASVLSLLAEFLMEKQEWNKALATYESILSEGSSTDKPAALYGAAQACLLLNQPEQAKAHIAALKVDGHGGPFERFANEMKINSPDSIHARLADFFSAPPAKEAESATSTQQVSEPLPEPTPVLGFLPTQISASEAAIATKPHADTIPAVRRFSVDSKVWHTDLSGHINAKGMNLHLNDGTNISTKNRFSFSGTWTLSRKDQLRLGYTQANHSGQLQKAVTFDGLLYSSGASIDLYTSHFDVGLSRLLSRSKHGSWKFLYGAIFSRSFTRLAQQMAGGIRSGELQQRFPMPYLGVECNARLSKTVTLSGSAKWFSVNRSGTAGRITDIDIALLFGRDYVKEPANTEWYGTLGYRFFSLHGEADTDSAELRYSGPTIGLESRF